ncbi:MAG: TetR/AcrR family transcriptional regulator [Flavobacteriaceae bacterium]
MEQLSVHFVIDSSLYEKNPESTDLGKKIVCNSIDLINTLGYEAFTFKKLGNAIGSNESSIYRYFESKHALLVYLVNCYWSWIEHKLAFATANINTAEKKLDKAIRLLTEEVREDSSFSFINEVLLSKIIISEATKAYHTKDVDQENEKGFYKTYKRVVQRVSDIVLEVNPYFKFPHMLISTVIEGAHQQRYFSEHLPALTNCVEGENSIADFYSKLVKSCIKE